MCHVNFKRGLMEGRIRAEWNRLKKVVVHKPGIEMFFGLLDPEASLYERAFDQEKAVKEHEALSEALKEQFKVKVSEMTDIIKEHAQKEQSVKDNVVKAALNSIDFSESGKRAKRLKDNIKENADSYGIDYFLNIMMLMPKMQLKDETGIKAIHINVTERDPLSNLYFMRDQQAVTDKGIFLSRMAKPQRRKETDFTKILWKIMKIPIVHEANAPATFEGGDFMPMKNFALVGLGDRTNIYGVKQMLNYGQSFDEVAVVHKPSHPLIPSADADPMVNMHLDTYFNVAGSDVVVGSKVLLEKAKVDIYTKNSESEYEISSKSTNLYDYITGKGFKLINISTLEQISYASNFLCVKDHAILAINTKSTVKNVLRNLELKANKNPERYAALLSQAKRDYKTLASSGNLFPHKKEMHENGIDYYAIDLENITGGYGGAHCMTAVIERG
jgi:arginine deiminase